MNTVAISTTIHAAITARRWVTHQCDRRRISLLVGWPPRVGGLPSEATERSSSRRRPLGRTLTTPAGAAGAAASTSRGRTPPRRARSLAADDSGLVGDDDELHAVARAEFHQDP